MERLDDPQRDRLRAPGADPGLPRAGAELRERHRRAAGGDLRGRSRWSDYFDGIAARLTGQYSRFGALLDPFVDRLLVVSGLVVCWYFELLPRWAIAVLVAREVLLLVVGQLALRARLQMKINWPGRAAVWPTMSAIFFALVGLATLAEVLLYIGLALAWYAVVLYVRDGLAQLRAARGDAG